MCRVAQFSSILYSNFCYCTECISVIFCFILFFCSLNLCLFSYCLFFICSMLCSVTGAVYLVYHLLFQKSIVWSDFNLQNDGGQLLEAGLGLFLLQVVLKVRLKKMRADYEHKYANYRNGHDACVGNSGFPFVRVK